MTDLSFDCATAQRRGRRDNQEDAIVTSFPENAEFGFVVLADGMGGHAAGSIAAKIVVSEVFSELLFQSDAILSRETGMTAVLRAAAQAADDCIAAHIRVHPDCAGMGSTLVAPIICQGSLWWISIGDSPLFLFRNGSLQQLNEDHSLGPQIDYMFAHGLYDAETAHNHPDRNVLTSALSGKYVARIDCPDIPFVLRPDDLLVVASDGLQFLDNTRIEKIITNSAGRTSADIARALIDALMALDDPDQDNITLSVIRVLDRSAMADEKAAPFVRRAAG